MMYALKEEQKKEIEEMDRNGVWERIKDRLKKDSQDSRSDEELLENFKPRENEFTEVRRLHRNTYAKRENLKSDDPYSRAVFEKWRNHEEAVFSSVRTTMANRRERSSLYQNGEIPPMNTDTPCRFIRSGDSPILPYHTTPKFAWKMDNSNARNKRLISRDTPPPWTHNGYGIEPSLVDNVTQLEGQNVDVWSNQKHESTIEGFTEADTERDIWTENKEYHLKQPDKIQKKLHNDIEHCTFNKNSCNHYNVTHEKAADDVSVAHNILTIRGNTLKNQMIESTPTKFDSWKENVKDESYLHPNMKQYKLAPKLAQYGSVENNNQIKNNNIMFKKKLENITTTLDTWKTKDTDCSDQQPKMKGYINGDKSAEYDFKENNYLTQSDNAVKKTREDKIQNNIDNPGSKYSLKRKREWKPVLDAGKYGSVAHLNHIKIDNAIRKKRLSTIHSNIDTWNVSNPGSRYSLQRKDKWEPVYDTRKYGSIAHYHQAKLTHIDNKYILINASTKLCTWQPKSKMNLLSTQHQKKINIYNPNMKLLMASVKSARPRVDTGFRRNDRNVSSWSRHVTGNTSSAPLESGELNIACNKYTQKE